MVLLPYVRVRYDTVVVHIVDDPPEEWGIEMIGIQ
jgi:hypothetical protein